MSKLYLVTHVSNSKLIAGIPHPHAVANIPGSAIFGFRKPSIAFKFAKAVDERIDMNSKPIFCEDLLDPFSNLIRGQLVDLKYHNNINSAVELNNTIVGRVLESEVSNYCAAMHISAIVLDEWTSGELLYVEDIIAPARSDVYSAGYLEYLFNMEDETAYIADDEEEEEARD